MSNSVKKYTPGEKYHRLTILRRVEDKSVECVCDCGNVLVVRTGNLLSGNTRSCGCLRDEVRSKTHKKALPLGSRFSRLTVVEEHPERKDGKVQYRCLCDCGTSVIVSGKHLRNGKTRSCGCLMREISSAVNTTHGLSKTKSHHIWWGMRSRCEKAYSISFSNYGARGISVCERWHSFEMFLEDMGEAPSGMSIERIDNNGDYSPENCRWATSHEQARNTRQNVWITFAGETLCLTDWADKIGIRLATLRTRLFSLGWTVERALTTPLRGLAKCAG